MPANIEPATYLTTLSNASGLLLTPNTSTGLTLAEANKYTGDIRKILYSELRQVHTAFNALPAADRPARFSITKSNPTGLSTNTIRVTFTLTFDLNIDEADVTAE